MPGRPGAARRRRARGPRRARRARRRRRRPQRRRRLRRVCPPRSPRSSAGKRLALANKESLIAGGPVVNAVAARRRRRDRARSTPSTRPSTRRCAAGRPTRSRRSCSPRAADRSAAGPAPSSSGSPIDDALKHPTWSMGPKITIDSSTLMNKGLEVIEAHELFGVDFDRIEVVVHPQSVVHGMVEFCDGATIAQLSMPDMRLPIGLALGAPARLDQAFGADRLVHARHPHLRAARPRRLPVPEPGLCGRPGRRRRPGHAQRGQRGRRGGVPGGPDRLARASPRSSTRCSRHGTGNVDDVADVLDADRVARAPGAATAIEKPSESA